MIDEDDDSESEVPADVGNLLSVWQFLQTFRSREATPKTKKRADVSDHGTPEWRLARIKEFSAFYKLYNPSKMSDVPSLLQNYPFEELCTVRVCVAVLNFTPSKPTKA